MMRPHGALLLLGALVEVSKSRVELLPGCATFGADVAPSHWPMHAFVLIE